MKFNLFDDPFRSRFLDMVHESSNGDVTTISGGEPARPANDGDGAEQENLTDLNELANLDKEFAESIAGKESSDTASGAKPKPVDAGKAADAKPAPAPDAGQAGAIVLTPEEMELVKGISPKLLSKFENLQRYLGQGRTVEDVLSNYNNNINDLMWMRAVSGRTGIPIDQLRQQIESAVVDYNRDASGAKPASTPKAVELDDATLTKWADRLAITKDDFKELFGVIQKATMPEYVGQMNDKLRSVEDYVNKAQEQTSTNLWNSFYDMAAKNPTTEKIFQQVKRDALDAIISQYEAASPGFSQSWINRNQNPYQVALKLYIAEFGSPEQFLASIGAQEVGKADVPPIQRPQGSMGAPGEKRIGDMTSKEFSAYLRKQTGDPSFVDFTEVDSEF